MVTFVVCIICELAWIFCYGLLLNYFCEYIGLFGETFFILVDENEQ